MFEGAEVISYESITFIIHEDRVIVCTKLQAFSLAPTDFFWNKRLDTVRMFIRIGKIKDLNSLAESCQDHIQWIPTKIPVMS